MPNADPTVETGTRENDSEQLRLLRTHEVAEMLAVSARTLWALTNCGEIPSIRIGRCIRYSRRDVLAWVERLRVKRR